MLHVIFTTVEKYQNIVQRNHLKNVYNAGHDLINISLKTSRDIDKIKKHLQIFKIFVTSAKRRFSLVIATNLNTMIDVFKIDFTEINVFIQLIQNLRDQKQ